MSQIKNPDQRKWNKKQVGTRYENLASRFLQAQGLRLVQRNYSCKAGEIDLVMSDKSRLVFVEVRYRHGGDYGGALASITPFKQKKLRRCAQHYLLVKGLTNHVACRFDVIGISPSCNDQDYQYHWIANAFY